MIKRDIPVKNSEAYCYQELIHNKTEVELDDRRNVIEIQLNKSVCLDNKVLLIVLPLVYLDDDDTLDKLENEWDAWAEGYDIHQGRPNDNITLIYDKFINFFRDNKLI